MIQQMIFMICIFVEGSICEGGNAVNGEGRGFMKVGKCYWCIGGVVVRAENFCYGTACA